MLFLFRRPFWLFCLAAVPAAWSQPAEDGEDRKVAEFTFQTFYFGSGGGDGVPELYYAREGDYRPLNLAPWNLGLRHRFSGPVPFAVYAERENEDGEIVYVPVGRLETKFESMKPGHQILLVRGEGDGYQLNAIPAGDDAVTPGEVLVFNGSRNPLAFRVGERKPLRLAPGDFTVTEYKEGGNERFRLEIAAARDDEWRLIHNASVTQVAERPLLLMVYPNQRVPDRWNVRFLRLNR